MNEFNDWFKMITKDTTPKKVAVDEEDKLEKLKNQYELFKLARKEDKETKSRWRVAKFKKNYPKKMKIDDIIGDFQSKIRYSTLRMNYIYARIESLKKVAPIKDYDKERIFSTERGFIICRNDEEVRDFENRERQKKIEEDLMKKSTDIFSC